MSVLIIAALLLALLQLWLLPASLGLKDVQYFMSCRDNPPHQTQLQLRTARAGINLQESLPAYLALCLLALIQQVDLTQAAAVWLVAALGMGIGLGEYLLVGVATVMVLLVLWAIPLLQRLTNARQSLSYEVTVPVDKDRHEEFLAIMETNHLNVSKSTMSKSGSVVNYVWRAYGKPADHQAAMLALIAEEDVQEFRAM